MPLSTTEVSFLSNNFDESQIESSHFHKFLADIIEAQIED
jgi:N-acetylmuramoyl-L-alanine amidase